MPRLLRSIALAGLCAVLVSCHLPSAMRRSGRIASEGWSTERWGGWVALTGPGGLLLATGDLALHALVPLHYDGYFLVDRREPEVQWFRFYEGPMRPLESVAVLCKEERGAHVRTIRRLPDGLPSAARHEKWHFPVCIEVLPGDYELEVHYFSRTTQGTREELATEHAESSEPSRVVWSAQAGALYLLRPAIGDPSPAPGRPPRSRIMRSKSLGTSRFKLQESEWAAEIERMPSWTPVGEPYLAHRERWARYERLR